MSNLADIKSKLANHSPKIYDYIEKWVNMEQTFAGHVEEMLWCQAIVRMDVL